MSSGIKWRGADGSEWDLMNGPMQLVPGGIRGLSFPPTQTYADSSPSLDGRRRRGVRVLERPVLLPLDIGVGLSPEEFRTQEAAFLRTFRPERPGTLSVTVDETRTLECSLDDTNDSTTFETDPFEEFGNGDMALPYPLLLELIADDPWWRGPEVVREFTAPEGEAFYPASESDPWVLNISSAAAIIDDSITNPGDEEAWPIYTILGPVTSFTITLAGSTISSGTINVPDGGKLVIDTDPNRQTALLTVGTTTTLVTRQLGAMEFRSVAAGFTRTLAGFVTGTGSMNIRFFPKYFRAWG